MGPGKPFYRCQPSPFYRPSFTGDLQSIRAEERYSDFISEIDVCEFDIFCLNETWRDGQEEIVATPHGHALYLSGGAGHCGGGICVCKNLRSKMSKVNFHALGGRLRYFVVWPRPAPFCSIFLLLSYLLGARRRSCRTIRNSETTVVSRSCRRTNYPDRRRLQMHPLDQCTRSNPQKS